MTLVQKEVKAVYIGTTKIRPNTVTTFSYLKWTITSNMGSTTQLQVSEFYLLDSDGNTFSRPSGTTVTEATSGSSSSESPSKIIDGSTSTKWYNGNARPNTLTIYLGGSTVDLSVYTRYQYYTANDASTRDPNGWTIYGSTDGSTWVEVGSESGLSITTTRKALAGTWDFTL